MLTNLHHHDNDTGVDWSDAEDALREAFAALGFANQMAAIGELPLEALDHAAKFHEFDNMGDYLRWLRGDLEAEGRDAEEDRFTLLREEMDEADFNELLYGEEWRKARESEEEWEKSDEARQMTREAAWDFDPDLPF